MLAKALERFTKWALSAWRDLSLDAKVVALFGVGNWFLLFANHTTVAATHDVPLWQLFPPGADAAFLIACGTLAFAYPFRDHRAHGSFTTRARVAHLAAIVATFVIIPTLASIILRETGKPYTYIHDGALMVEEASRKFLAGMNPYVADYLDTPMFFWPMINNPALYHLTYFPFMFLVTGPFVWFFDHVGLVWDQRYLYLPAYIGTLALVPFIVQGTARRLAMTAAIALNPQLFPFVVEGRNDFFVLLFLFAGIALLMRERRTTSSLAFAASGAAKLHALIFLPFVAVYLIATKRPRNLREAFAALAPTWPAALFLLATFVPFLANNFGAFYGHPPRTRVDPVPAGGLPVRSDRDRGRGADRGLVVHPALAAAHDRHAPRRLRAHAARLPFLRAVLPGELPRVHRRRLHAGPVPRDTRGSARAAARPPAGARDRHGTPAASRAGARAAAIARADAGRTGFGR